MPTRRSFIAGAASAATLATRVRTLWAQRSVTPPELTVTINPGNTGPTMPRDFVGLSYESAQLGHPDFFSAADTALVGLFKTLNPTGVLRIGGNTGEYTTWSPNDADAEKNQTPHAMGPDAGTAAKTASIITPLAIRNLKAFIEKTAGWRVIYGLNLWHGTPENAAAEATYVANTLGDTLICFQIGNEPDMNHDVGSKDRWTFDHYYERWTGFVAAVKQAVPNARFAGPDIAKEYDWITKMANKHPDIVFLSGHSYAEGPPANPKMTLEYLLKRGNDPATDGEIETVHAATKASGLPFWKTETNSCFHGGKPLVSDTLASALWGADYMLQIAQAGYIGVNLHGGGNGLYTPIAGDTDGFTARPLYYGMLLAEQFSGATFVAADLSTQADPQNTTAFAAKTPSGKWKLAIFNKAAQPQTVKLTGLPVSKSGSIEWLQGPAIDSHTGITFAGSSVGPAGQFTPKPQAQLKFVHGTATLELPPYTGACIEA